MTRGGEGGQNRVFYSDVINEWPLMLKGLTLVGQFPWVADKIIWYILSNVKRCISLFPLQIHSLPDIRLCSKTNVIV